MTVKAIIKLSLAFQQQKGVDSRLEIWSSLGRKLAKYSAYLKGIFFYLALKTAILNQLNHAETE